MISFPLINLNYWSQRLEIFCKAFWPTMATSIRFDQNMGNISFFKSLIECVSYQSFKVLEILGATLEDVKLNFNSNSYFDYFSNSQCAMMKKTSAHQENKRKMGRCTQLLKFKSTFSSRKICIFPNFDTYAWLRGKLTLITEGKLFSGNFAFDKNFQIGADEEVSFIESCKLCRLWIWVWEDLSHIW